MKIYVAGKNLNRAETVMSLLRTNGHVITYDWTRTLSDGPTRNIAVKEAQAVRDADVLVYLWESDQESARYETGMAMGLEKPIVVSGKDDAFFFQLPNIHTVDSDREIPEKVREIT